MDFPHLRSPLRIRNVTIPNRMIMGSMHLGFETEMGAHERLARFYAERAEGGAGLIVTGGVAPNAEGRFGQDGTVLDDESKLDGHRVITSAVHDAQGRILMQILHCGRYGRHSDIVGPSAIRAPINPVVPREMTEDDIARTVLEYGRCARLAAAAGYDGVEVMASEGYLINEFMAPRTNKRTDRWGGGIEGRLRFLLETVRSVRAGLGSDLLLSVRLSMVDLVEDGLSGDEVVAAAKALEEEQVDLINCGIGWHEAKIPTIAFAVPEGTWAWAPARVKAAVSVPVASSTRISSPEMAEKLIAEGKADLISMARPMMADPRYAAKVEAGQGDDINRCIGCNQGCLDRMFAGKAATCLVNPRAGREAEFEAAPASVRKNLAVVGGGPSGMACALEAAKRGHGVTLFEAGPDLGGQFLHARVLPGKRDYLATLNYYGRAMARAGVEVRTGHAAISSDLGRFDEVVLASGILPRNLDIPGADNAKVVSYEDILSGRVVAGEKVVVTGSGGIGHDVASFLVEDRDSFDDMWGLDRGFTGRGALKSAKTKGAPARQVVMTQRKPGPAGGSLGKTTGWIQKANLQRMGVTLLSGVTYRRIDDQGLHVEIDGESRLLEADTIVVCIGQEPRNELRAAVEAMGKPLHLIGGARDAKRLDALAAFEEGTRLGLAI